MKRRKTMPRGRRKQETSEPEVAKVSPLIAVAEELNKLMGLIPPIDGTQSEDKLREQIIKAAGELTAEDVLTPETEAVLTELGCFKTAPEEGGPEPEPDPEAAPEAPAKSAKDLPLPELVASIKKLTELKDVVNDYPEFKSLIKGIDKFAGLSGVRELKAAMFKILGVNPAELKPPKPAAGTGKRGRGAAGGPTKKSIVIEYVSRPNGATVEEMAQAVTAAGLGDIETNRKTVKLWLPKLGFPVKKTKKDDNNILVEKA